MEFRLSYSFGSIKNDYDYDTNFGTDYKMVFFPDNSSSVYNASLKIRCSLRSNLFDAVRRIPFPSFRITIPVN